MIYEMRTYTLRSGAVAEYESRFAEALPHREKHSRLGAFWHTTFGSLNQVIHVWPYENLAERARVRVQAAQEPNWPPPSGDMILSMETEVLTPAPFMRPLGDQRLGDMYEMRVYTYQIGSIPEVIRRWSEAVPHREKYSPMAACWYTQHGGINKWFHVWPYRDLTDRQRIRAEAIQDPHWPPGTAEFQVRQENKIMAPASFSPMK